MTSIFDSPRYQPPGQPIDLSWLWPPSHEVVVGAGLLVGLGFAIMGWPVELALGGAYLFYAIVNKPPEGETKLEAIEDALVEAEESL